MTKLATLGLLALLPIVAASLALAAEDEIMSVVKSGICPKDLSRLNTIKYSDYCKGFEDRPCNDRSGNCFHEAAGCWSDVNNLNKEIYTYNKFVANCAKPK